MNPPYLMRFNSGYPNRREAIQCQYRNSQHLPHLNRLIVRIANQLVLAIRDGDLGLKSLSLNVFYLGNLVHEIVAHYPVPISDFFR